MIDSKVFLQKRVFSKLLDRSPAVFESFMESTSDDVEKLLLKLESDLKNQNDKTKEYYNVMFKCYTKVDDDGNITYSDRCYGVVPPEFSKSKIHVELNKINDSKNSVKAYIDKLNKEKALAETPEESSKIDSDIQKFNDRLKKINDNFEEVKKEYDGVYDKIQKDVGYEKKNIIQKTAGKLAKTLIDRRKEHLKKPSLSKITEAANGMISDLNTYVSENKLSVSDRNVIVGIINETVNEFKVQNSFDTFGFPPTTFTENSLSYDEIYEHEQMEASSIIDRLMDTYLSKSAGNSYDFIITKSSKVHNLYEGVQLFKESNVCKNDTANAIAFLAIESALCGDISSEDCGEILAVLESEAFVESLVGNVASMMPIIGLSGTKGIGTPLSKAPITDVVKSTNVKADAKEKEENKDLVTESVVPKNNVIFDKEVKNVYDKLKPNLDIKEDEDDSSFNKALNFRKNKYIFSIKNSEDKKVQSTVINILKGSGFIENKDKGIVVNYTKSVSDTDMTVEYNVGDDSIVFSYVYKSKDVKESVDIDYYQEAVLRLDKYIDLFTTYESVMDSLYAKDHDLVRSAKCRILLERCDDEYTKELVSEFDKVHLEKCNLNKDSYLEDTSLDDELNRIYGNICEHPFMKPISDNFDMLYESDANIDDDIKSILTRLHRKGYKTLYSCSGHNGTRKKEDNFRDGIYYGKLYTTARVTFDRIYDFKNTPNGWYKSEKDNKTSFYVTPVTYDKKQGSVDEAFAKWKAIYLENLRSWSKVVPELNEEVTESVSDLIDEFINGFE